MMDADEREVYYYLKSQPDQSVPESAISRHAGGKKKYRETPDWAKSVIVRMLERGIVELDEAGGYRLKPMPQKLVGPKRWVSPQIAAILRKSGGKFDGVIKGDDDMDAYYNNL